MLCLAWRNLSTTLFFACIHCLNQEKELTDSPYCELASFISHSTVPVRGADVAAIGREREKVTTMSVDMSMEFSTHDDEESMSSSHNEEEHDISSFRLFAGMTHLGSPPSALRELPTLRDAPPNKRKELFKLKLQLCGAIFSFNNPTSDKRGKVCYVRIFHFFIVLILLS